MSKADDEEMPGRSEARPGPLRTHPILAPARSEADVNPRSAEGQAQRASVAVACTSVVGLTSKPSGWLLLKSRAAAHSAVLD